MDSAITIRARYFRIAHICAVSLAVLTASNTKLAQHGWAKQGAVNEVARLEISITDKQLRLDAANVPLRDVLAALAKQSGFELELRAPAHEIIFQSVRDLPIHVAIKRILDAGGYSHVLEFGQVAVGNDYPLVAKVTVFSSNAIALKGSASSPVVMEPSVEPDPLATVDAELRKEVIDTLEQALEEDTDPARRQAATEMLTELENSMRR